MNEQILLTCWLVTEALWMWRCLQWHRTRATLTEIIARLMISTQGDSEHLAVSPAIKNKPEVLWIPSKNRFLSWSQSRKIWLGIAKATHLFPSEDLGSSEWRSTSVICTVQGWRIRDDGAEALVEYFHSITHRPVPVWRFNFQQSVPIPTRLLNAVRKTSTHYLGRDCAAIETQMVSMSLLYKVQ